MGNNDATEHDIVGYDRKTGLALYAKPVPAELLDRIKALVGDIDDDPGCLELTQEQADEVSRLMGCTEALPDGLDFFFEDSAPALGE